MNEIKSKIFIINIFEDIIYEQFNNNFDREINKKCKIKYIILIIKLLLEKELYN